VVAPKKQKKNPWKYPSIERRRSSGLKPETNVRNQRYLILSKGSVKYATLILGETRRTQRKTKKNERTKAISRGENARYTLNEGKYLNRWKRKENTKGGGGEDF